MTAALLYARSRRLVGLTGGLAVLGLASAVLASLGDRNSTSLPWATVLSMSAAALIGVSLHSPFAAAELAAPARPLAVARLAHTVLGGALALLLLLPASWQAGTQGTPAATARGLLGFLGLALVSARLLGAVRSCIPVLAAGVAVISLSPPGFGSRALLWGWTGSGGGGAVAWASAGVLFAAACLVGGPRDLTTRPDGRMTT